MTLRITIETEAGKKLRADQVTATTVGEPLKRLTLAEALTWVETNVTDLASARNALKEIAKVLFLLQGEVRRKG
jgi:hypothetical protein